MVAIATIIDVFNVKYRHIEFARGLSYRTNLVNLFWEKQSTVEAMDYEFKVIEYFKSAVILLGCVSHYLCCLESPIGILMLSAC